MLVYVYAADLLCEDCGQKCREELTAAGKTPEDPNDESSYDSDDFPKGPSEEGESDTPSYCAGCGVFLESTLTDEGAAYVSEVLREHYTAARPRASLCAAEWREYYRSDSRVITGPVDDDDDDEKGSLLGTRFSPTCLECAGLS